MADNYWVRYKGRSIGPYALDRVRQMVRKGQVGRSHEVSLDGASWVVATSFPEIFEPPAPAPVVVPAAVAPVPQVQSVNAGPASEGGPPTETATWYCAVDGVQQGPMPRSQVVALIRSGRLSGGDVVFRTGMADWTAAADVPELAAAFVSQGGPAVGNATVGVDAFCRACGAGINKHAVICPKCGAPAGDGLPAPMSGPLVFAEPRRQVREGDKKSKTVAALLALLVGGLGAHHFYLNNAVLGIFYLVFCFTFIPAIIAFIEAIVFLTMSDEAFDAKYNS